MEIAKYAAVCLQAISVSILGMTFLGIKSEAVPRIVQPLFLVPWYAYVALVLVLLVVVVTTREKIRQITDAPPPPPALRKIDTVSYKDVNWEILAPEQHPKESAADYARRLPGIAEVRIPPKCPKCAVELEERKALLFGHIWQCVSCGFRKRNRETFPAEAARAGKIWKGKAEADAAAAAAAAAPAVPPAPAAAADPEE
jgi:ribosomal protein L37AE/L43A